LRIFKRLPQRHFKSNQPEWYLTTGDAVSARNHACRRAGFVAGGPFNRAVLRLKNSLKRTWFQYVLMAAFDAERPFRAKVKNRATSLGTIGLNYFAT